MKANWLSVSRNEFNFFRECLPKVYVERNMFYRALENLTTWKIFLKDLKKWTISSTSSLWFWGSSFSAPGAGRLWVIVEGDPETCLCFGIVAQGLGNLTKNFSKLSYDPIGWIISAKQNYFQEIPEMKQQEFNEWILSEYWRKWYLSADLSEALK